MIVQIVFAHALSKSPHAPFGNKNSLPWKHNTEDLSEFKSTTANSVLVMGSNTFESLPGKLVGRPHVVLSSTNVATAKNGERADFYTSKPISELIEDIKSVYSQQGYDKISFIGGPQLIEAAYRYADCIYKTSICENIEEYDTTIDLVNLFFHFPHARPLKFIECDNGSSIYIEKLTKGDL